MNANTSIVILGTRGIPAKYGGFETFAEELAVRLVKQGIDVTVYCDSVESARYGTYKGVKLEYVPSPSLGAFTTVLFDMRSLWRARRGHEIVYMLGYGVAPACIVPRLWGCTVWLNVDGIEWARAKWGRIAKIYFKLMESFAMWTPNRVIADAEGIRSHLASRHWRLPPCSVIPYGAPIIEEAPNAALITEWGLAARYYYLVVARIEPENHVQEIIEGYKAACTGVPLVIVGNHNSGTSYANVVRRSANTNIRFIGGVYEKDKLQALRYYSLAYIHGHSAGGTNPSLLEALGCGNLIIAHDNVFNREVAGDIGFYFKHVKDIPAILEDIEAISSQARGALESKAKLRIREKYDWDSITDSYMKILIEDAK